MAHKMFVSRFCQKLCPFWVNNFHKLFIVNKIKFASDVFCFLIVGWCDFWHRIDMHVAAIKRDVFSICWHSLTLIRSNIFRHKQQISIKLHENWFLFTTIINIRKVLCECGQMCCHRVRLFVCMFCYETGSWYR